MGFLGLGGDKVTTTTDTLGAADTAATLAGRAAGDVAAEAAMGVEAAGVNPYTQQAMDQYGQQYDQYGNLMNQYGGMAQSALDFANQTGLQGMDQYMNPMLQQYYASQNPLWAEQMGMAGMQANQNSSLQGAFGGSRGAIANEYGQRMVGMQQMADYGQKGYQSARDAAQMLMGERGRMGQQGMGLAGLQGQYADRMGGTTRNLMLGGDYLRNIENEQNRQGYVNAANAAQAQLGSYGRDTKRISEQREEGSVLGDLMGIGGMVAGTLIPGAGSALSALGIGGGGSPNVQGPMVPQGMPASPGIQTPILQPPEGYQNPWQRG